MTNHFPLSLSLSNGPAGQRIAHVLRQDQQERVFV
jgi:hypothetical protein